MKKKIVATFLAVSMLASMFTGCGNKEIATDSTVEVETPETPTDTAEVDETEPVTEEDTNSDTDTNKAEAEQEKIYAPAIEDDIKDEVLAAYQKFMDEHECDECMFFGMDSSELPLLYVRGSEGVYIILYSSGTVSSIKATNTFMLGGIVIETVDVEGTNYYEIRDGEIELLCSEGYYDDKTQQYKNYDGNGNEIDNVYDILPDTNGIESIYAQRTFALGGDVLYSNVEEAYIYMNKSKDYAPAIEDDIKDEVLAAYQKFMDENECDKCMFFGMDSSELPLLYVEGDESAYIILYSSGTLSSIKAHNATISGGILIKTIEDIIYYYEIRDGKIELLCSEEYDGGRKYRDGDGNEFDSASDILPDTDGVESIYSERSFMWNSRYDNVEDAYTHRNEP